MRHQEQGIVVLVIRCAHSQHDAGYAADDEAGNKGQSPQHGGGHLDPALAHGEQPVEHLHTRRHGNEHGGDGEERVHRRSGAHRIEVMHPNQHTQECDPYD
ncbi:hypothetical protein D3C76_1203850 [compost metagenome]